MWTNKFGFTMIILNEISTHVTPDKTTPFTNNPGLFDQRLKEFVNVPEVHHLKWCTFTCNGLFYNARNKRNLEKSYDTGSGGGFRSREYVVALMEAFLLLVIYIYKFIYFIIIFYRLVKWVKFSQIKRH